MKEARLDVVVGQGMLKKWIVFEIDLADGEVVRGAPVGVHLGEEFRSGFLARG
jgi:hypothetical protein